MKKCTTRLCCLLLALLLVVSVALPALAAEDGDETAQEDMTKDYVILLDCSLSTSLNDTKNLCLQACWNFLDKLPLYDTRVSIITFGYEVKKDPGYTDFDSFEVKSQKDMALLHELVPLVELNSSAVRDEYKLMVQKALDEYRYESKSTFTPYTHALAAAVDMLEKNTKAEDSRNACIILITDGVLDDREYYHPDKPYGVSDEALRLLTEASKKAGTHDWPIYSIQLNYDNADPYESKLATQRLAEISANGGKNDIGSVACTDDNGVFVALMDIFSDFMGLGKIIPENLKLPGSVYFDVGPLTSEASVDIFGEGITGVSLYQVDENNKRIKEYKTNISTDVDQKDLMVAANPGYYSVKMICPDEGRWEVYIDGTGGANVTVYPTSIHEMRLSMNAEAIQAGASLTKNDSVKVSANYTYHGIVKDNDPNYEKMPSELKIFNKNGQTIYTVDHESEYYHADKTGYHFELPLSLFPDEDLVKLQVLVKDGMFRDGIKHSNLKTFSFVDLPTTLKEGVDPKSVSLYVGQETKLDMREIYDNPDGDPLEYILTCTNDPAVTFEHTMENDQMTIEAGLKPGTYEITIDVKGEKIPYDGLTLTVLNNAPYLKDKIKDLELWSDHYGFQKIEDIVNTVDLNAHFKDTEGMTMAYLATLSEDGVVEITEKDGILTAETIEGVKEGKVTVTVTATDGITPDSTGTATFEIKVISGKLVFWRDNWIYFAIAGAILLIIIICILLVLKNMLVKGEWQITVDDNDSGLTETIPNVNIAGFLSVGKKNKFKLADMMTELTLFLNGGWNTTFATYFSTPGASDVTLLGVTRKKGCDITGIPANGMVRVNINGVDVTRGKGKLHTGTLTIVIDKNDGFGGRLTITMTLL